MPKCVIRTTFIPPGHQRTGCRGRLEHVPGRARRLAAAGGHEEAQPRGLLRVVGRRAAPLRAGQETSQLVDSCTQ